MRRHPSADDLAAHALGALEPREERRVSAHVQRCDRCAAELTRNLLPAVDVLAESVERIEPPDTLRQGVMATVHQEAGAPAAAPAAREGGGRSRRGRLTRPAAGLAVLALCAAGVAGYLIAQGGEEAGTSETIALPSTASGGGGTLVREDGEATLHVHGMGQLDQGAVYQVWVATPAGVVPSASFVPHEDGTATAAVPEAVGDATEVMITTESSVGHKQPTLPPVMDLRLD